MAARLRKVAKLLNRSFAFFMKQSEPNIRPVTSFRTSSKVVGLASVAAGAIGCSLYYGRRNIAPPVHAKSKEDRQEERREMLRIAREMRFLTFATVEYDGNVYMTPQDFLDSVTRDSPKPRVHREKPQESEIKLYLRKTPNKKNMAFNMFRSIGKEGLISYTEYLFLLCVITKPYSGFRIAFNMFDTDGNEQVDKKEFLVLVEVVHETLGLHAIAATDRIEGGSNIWKILKGTLEDDPDQVKNEAKLKSEVPDTTLTMLFFGKDGRDTLNYEDFERFMNNLQTEVLDLEFKEFSRGSGLITEEDFAKILLRYTVLNQEEQKQFMDRLRRRNLSNKGIPFETFRNFCRFLNSLDDFAMAMKIYKMLGKTVDKGTFQRVVKAVSGYSMDDHLATVIFDLFDADGDGHLSHKEFLSVMKDRLHRGFRSQHIDHSRWDHYKTCIKHEMRA